MLPARQVSLNSSHQHTVCAISHRLLAGSFTVKNELALTRHASTAPNRAFHRSIHRVFKPGIRLLPQQPQYGYQCARRGRAISWWRLPHHRWLHHSTDGLPRLHSFIWIGMGVLTVPEGSFSESSTKLSTTEGAFDG